LRKREAATKAEFETCVNSGLRLALVAVGLFMFNRQARFQLHPTCSDSTPCPWTHSQVLHNNPDTTSSNPLNCPLLPNSIFLPFLAPIPYPPYRLTLLVLPLYYHLCLLHRPPQLRSRAGPRCILLLILATSYILLFNSSSSNSNNNSSTTNLGGEPKAEQI
jgi:hypothetical protein